MLKRASFVVVVCAVTVVSLLTVAGPASAGKPIRIFEHNVHFVCESGVTNEFGTAQVDAEDHSEFGTSGSILYWVAPDSPETDEATYRSSAVITDQHVTRNGYHFDGVLLMEDQDFNPVGNGSFSVDLIPTGRVDEGPGKTREGNRTIRDNSRVEFFSVAGTVTMHDGTVFDLTDCGGPDGSGPDTAGFDTTIDIRISDPSQFVLNFSGILVLCDIVTDDYAMNLGASSDKSGTSGVVVFSSADGSLRGFTNEGLTLTNEVFAGVFPLTNEDTGEPAGEALVDATFTQGERLMLRTENEEGVRSTRIGYQLNPTGTITFPSGTVVDLSSCFGFDGREQRKQHRPEDGEPEE